MASSSETAKESAEITPTRTESPSAPVPPEKLLWGGGKPVASAAGKPNQQAAQFTLSSLTPATLSASPLTQFHTWYSESSTHPPTVKTPETCTLATASLPSGRVSARIVYLKQLDTRGFVIYTNTAHSRKSADLRTNGLASLVFWWAEQERQVRVEGAVEFLPAPESQQYYDTRIRASRIGAWASPQSAVIADRAELEQKVREREAEFAGNEKIPVPPHWGGVRLVPDMVEFWQGREGRLHDRFRYTKKGDGGVGADDDGEGWKVERLAP
ncbi:MAG: hypothetical protein M1819_001209 [Sarea resinae]|nr:MAG: hypothetical protein M1819_001209 [Sarea resinae]